MTIKEFLLSMAHYLADLLLRRYTGKVIITLDMRNGGIGHAGIHTDHTLKKNTTPIDDIEILKK